MMPLLGLQTPPLVSKKIHFKYFNIVCRLQMVQTLVTHNFVYCKKYQPSNLCVVCTLMLYSAVTSMCGSTKKRFTDEGQMLRRLSHWTNRTHDVTVSLWKSCRIPAECKSRQLHFQGLWDSENIDRLSNDVLFETSKVFFIPDAKLRTTNNTLFLAKDNL